MIDCFRSCLLISPPSLKSAESCTSGRFTHALLVMSFHFLFCRTSRKSASQRWISWSRGRR